MTVKELKNKLDELPEDYVVVTNAEVPNTGCDTCGYGALLSTKNLDSVQCLEGSGEVELFFY